jgi:hypothetical protein
MWGSTVLRAIAVLALVGLFVGIGATAYNAGVTAGLTEAAAQAAASGDPAPAVIPGYGFGYGWGGPYWHGPGFFGILGWILGFLLVFALLRAAFGWGGHRHGGPGGWGRSDRMAEFHRELHRREASADERAAGA